MNDLATTYRSPRTEAALRYATASRELRARGSKSAKAQLAWADARRAMKAATEADTIPSGQLPSRDVVEAAKETADKAERQALERLNTERMEGVTARLRLIDNQHTLDPDYPVDPDDLEAIQAWNLRLIALDAAHEAARAVSRDLEALRRAVYVEEREQADREATRWAAQREADELLERAARAKAIANMADPADVDRLSHRLDDVEVLAITALTAAAPTATVKLTRGADR